MLPKIPVNLFSGDDLNKILKKVGDNCNSKPPVLNPKVTDKLCFDLNYLGMAFIHYNTIYQDEILVDMQKNDPVVESIGLRREMKSVRKSGEILSPSEVKKEIEKVQKYAERIIDIAKDIYPYIIGLPHNIEIAENAARVLKSATYVLHGYSDPIINRKSKSTGRPRESLREQVVFALTIPFRQIYNAEPTSTIPGPFVYFVEETFKHFYKKLWELFPKDKKLPGPPSDEACKRLSARVIKNPPDLDDSFRIMVRNLEKKTYPE